MLIYPRYLQEIEDICQGKLDQSRPAEDAVGRYVETVLLHHWGNPDDYQGLFYWCAPCRTTAWNNAQCGCLTQVKAGQNVVSVTFADDGEETCHIVEDLTKAIQDDAAIAAAEINILPEHLRRMQYPLPLERQVEIRKYLLPYAAQQTRLRQYFKDLPDDEPQPVEVTV